MEWNGIYCGVKNFFTICNDLSGYNSLYANPQYLFSNSDSASGSDGSSDNKGSLKFEPFAKDDNLNPILFPIEIHVSSGKDVSAFSLFPEHEDVLLFPGKKFSVEIQRKILDGQKSDRIVIVLNEI